MVVAGGVLRKIIEHLHDPVNRVEVLTQILDPKIFTEVKDDNPIVEVPVNDGVELTAMEHPTGPRGALRGKRIRKNSIETTEIELDDTESKP